MTSLIHTIKRIRRENGNISEGQRDLLWATDELVIRYNRYLAQGQQMIWHNTIQVDQEDPPPTCSDCQRLIEQGCMSYLRPINGEHEIVCPSCLTRWLLAGHADILKKPLAFTDWHEVFQIPYHHRCMSRWQQEKSLIHINDAWVIPLSELLLDLAILDPIVIGWVDWYTWAFEESLDVLDPETRILRVATSPEPQTCLFCQGTIAPDESYLFQYVHGDPDATGTFCLRCYCQYVVTYWMPFFRASSLYWNFTSNSRVQILRNTRFSGIRRADLVSEAA